jgi:putative salt-induced outer membrane protein YdiY
MIRSVLLAAVTVLLGFEASADEVQLANGDRLTGRAIALDAEALTFETEYAGELRIGRASIVALRTDEPRAWRDASGVVNESVLQVIGTTPEAPASAGAVPLEAVAAFADTAHDLAPDAAPEVPRRVWTGSVNLGGAYRTGNTEKADITLSTAWTRTAERHRLILGAAWAYGESEDVLNTRKLSGTGRWEFDLTERLYVFTLGGAERDDGRQLDLRANTALGLGYQFWNEDSRKLSVDLGAEYAYEEWAPFTPWGREPLKSGIRLDGYNRAVNLVLDLVGGAIRLDGGSGRALLEAVRDVRDPLRGYASRTENYMTARLGARYEQQLFERGRVSDTAVLSANLEDAGEYRFTNELAFTTPLSEKLALKIALASEFDSLAEVLGLEAWDHTLTTGLSYSF